MSIAETATRLRNLPAGEAVARLGEAGLGLRVGPFDLRLRVGLRSVHEPLISLYADHEVLDGDRVFSIHADLQPVWRLGRRPGRYVRFSVDGMTAHEDLPAGQGLAVLEWGINLAVAMRFHGFLMLHAAAAERAGRAMLLPAGPGHGKTTLCAALVHRGWRLFSDEFGLLRAGDTRLIPVPRPLPLKNESIEVLRAFAPEAVLGPTIPGTRKGTIAHLKPPAESVRRSAEPASIAWIVFPRWVAGTSLALEEIGRGEGFMQLATNAFNYELLGEAAFESVRRLVGNSRCYRLVYSDLAAAVAQLTELADRDDR